MNQLIELPDVSFSKSFRGYSVNDVEAYLQQMQEVVAHANRMSAQMNEQIMALQKEINRLQEAENALIRALNLAEDAKESLRLKAENESKELLASAKKEIEKMRLLFDQEKIQQKEQLKKEILEQERAFLQLKEAQKVIASQLLDISKVTMHKVGEWEKVGQKEEVRGNKEEGVVKKEVQKRRGRPVAKKVEGKPLGKKKSPGRPKKVDPATEVEDGLPTLGKVLEAYAKSNQPKGKIADMN